MEFLEDYKRQPEVDSYEVYYFTIQDADPGYKGGIADTGTGQSSKGASEKEDYNAKTVSQLKEICRENGLPVSGRKADLIERIEAHLAKGQEQKKEAMENVDPSTRLEMLIVEYLHAKGGEASSRDIGRYLAANSASKERLRAGNGDTSALSELKELSVSLISFIKKSPYFYVKDDGSRSAEFYVCVDKDAVRKVETMHGLTIPN